MRTAWSKFASLAVRQRGDICELRQDTRLCVTRFADCSIFTRETVRTDWDDMTELAGWANFFVIVGSSAGALIGLQFVVITLVADLPAPRAWSRRAAHMRRPPLFISELCCYSRLFSARPGTALAGPHWFGSWWASLELRIPSSWLGVCEHTPDTSPCSKTGCFMRCSPS